MSEVNENAMSSGNNENVEMKSPQQIESIVAANMEDANDPGNNVTSATMLSSDAVSSKNDVDLEAAKLESNAKETIMETTTTSTTDTTDNGSVAKTTTAAAAAAAAVSSIANGDNVGTSTATSIGQQQPKQQEQMQSTRSSGGAETETKGKMDVEAGLTNFRVLYIVTQLCGITMIILMGSWIGTHMGGLAGTSNPSIEFNWHPLLMTIGLIFLYGNSILVYRGFRSTRKKMLKITHASIHMGAFILTVIALKAAFDSHNLAANPLPNMYSLHSWLGLSAVIIFCMQYVAGFMAYMVPGLREQYKIAYMPLHIYFGLFGFVLAIASALMGITEKMIFSIPNFSALPSSVVMVNMCGVLFVIFGALVVYLTTEPSYKRKPRPEDTVLLTGANE